MDEDVYQSLLIRLYSLLQSISIIIVSEIGDKTFFTSAILAMKYPKKIVFLGSMTALFLMTALSVFFGKMATKLLSHDIAMGGAVFLFLVIGIKLLYDGYHMAPSKNCQEELQIVTEEISSQSTMNLLKNSNNRFPFVTKITDVAKITSHKITKYLPFLGLIFQPAFMQSFMLVFLGEWGDRSQISTIALSSHEDIFIVGSGSLIGHCICTTLAILSGVILSKKLSIRTITIIGGLTFLFFGILTAFFSE